jgi:hypothetical protein
VPSLVHAEQLPGLPAVVCCEVDADYFSLGDCCAAAGVGREVDGARAAKEARVIRVEEEGTDEEAAAADDRCSDDEVALWAAVRDAGRRDGGLRARALPGLKSRRTLWCRKSSRARQPALPHHSPQNLQKLSFKSHACERSLAEACTGHGRQVHYLHASVPGVAVLEKLPGNSRRSAVLQSVCVYHQAAAGRGYVAEGSGGGGVG